MLDCFPRKVLIPSGKSVYGKNVVVVIKFFEKKTPSREVSLTIYLASEVSRPPLYSSSELATRLTNWKRKYDFDKVL